MDGTVVFGKPRVETEAEMSSELRERKRKRNGSLGLRLIASDCWGVSKKCCAADDNRARHDVPTNFGCNTVRKYRKDKSFAIFCWSKSILWAVVEFAYLFILIARSVWQKFFRPGQKFRALFNAEGNNKSSTVNLWYLSLSIKDRWENGIRSLGHLMCQKTLGNLAILSFGHSWMHRKPLCYPLRTAKQSFWPGDISLGGKLQGGNDVRRIEKDKHSPRNLCWIEQPDDK